MGKFYSSAQAETKQLIYSIVSLVYFMRGSLSYSEAMNMCSAERQVVHDFLKDRFEQEKNNPYPVY